MASPPVIEVEGLLQPISEAAAAGEDLRADQAPDSAYYKVKDARTSARAAERNETGDQTGIMVEEWRAVLELVPDLLTSRTKDLEIAAWYTEAMLRAEGFAGLRDAFRLATGLVEKFWDGIYPLPDDDGIETRVASFTGLNGEGGEGTLILPMRKAVLLHGAERPLAFWHLEKANEIAKITDQARKERMISEGAVTSDEVQAALAATPPAAVAALVEDIKECQEAFKALEKAFTDKCGNDAPPSSNIRQTLGAILDMLTFFAKDRLAMAQASAGAEEAPAGDGATTAAGGAARAAGSPAPGTYTRETAFNELLRIATFFRGNEPHSPISYTLEELVRRGRMPMPDLLAELIPDPGARSQFFLAAGIKPPEPPA
ncbi:MAG: type VI secretion system protein TssA [Alphaproteobacteria bacterium]|nr:type VI secretion system protein TssA [Alphaproteobacteria bacterium]